MKDLSPEHRRIVEGVEADLRSYAEAEVVGHRPDEHLADEVAAYYAGAMARAGAVGVVTNARLAWGCPETEWAGVLLEFGDDGEAGEAEDQYRSCRWSEERPTWRSRPWAWLRQRLTGHPGYRCPYHFRRLEPIVLGEATGRLPVSVVQMTVTIR